MQILFMGTPTFAVPSLHILLENKYTIPAVVTAPDRPRGRGQQVSFTSVKEFARDADLPVLQPETTSDPKFIAEVQRLQPDLIVVVAFRILPKEVYTVPKLGAFNLHASLLPKYRGAAPINWAIINGEIETGVTTFFLQEAVDTGTIILQERIPIGPEETAGELYEKLSRAGAETVLQTVRLIERGEARTSQQDNARASAAPKIFKEQCRIDWTKPAKQVHDFVRGLSPHPAAWTTLRDKLVKIYKTAIDGEWPADAGAVVKSDARRLVAATGRGAVEILELQQEGKRRLPAEEFLRGTSIKAGEKFV
jgi:methionyl-tRNA formyltransferase